MSQVINDVPELRVVGKRFDQLKRGNEVRVGSRVIFATCEAPTEGDPVMVLPKAGSMNVRAKLGKHDANNHSWTIVPAEGG